MHHGLTLLPSLSSLMAIGFFSKEHFRNGPAFTPPPLLIAWPFVQELFFAASLTKS